MHSWSRLIACRITDPNTTVMREARQCIEIFDMLLFVVRIGIEHSRSRVVRAFAGEAGRLSLILSRVISTTLKTVSDATLAKSPANKGNAEGEMNGGMKNRSISDNQLIQSWWYKITLGKKFHKTHTYYLLTDQV